MLFLLLCYILSAILINSSSVLSIHDVATGDPSLMGIQLNRLSQTNSLSNSLSHNPLCDTNLEESPRIHSYSQTGSHPPEVHSPPAPHSLAVRLLLPPLPPAVHSPPGLLPPPPPPTYPPPTPPSTPQSPPISPPPPPPSPNQTHSRCNSILQTHRYECSRNTSPTASLAHSDRMACCHWEQSTTRSCQCPRPLRCPYTPQTLAPRK